MQNLTLAEVNITGNSNVGGMAGYNFEGTVTACYWADNLSQGIFGDSGKATQVDGTTVIWKDAQSGLNTAIDTWNGNNPGKQCNWRYEGATATTPPKPVSTN